jgi:hypothetical protein
LGIEVFLLSGELPFGHTAQWPIAVPEMCDQSFPDGQKNALEKTPERETTFFPDGQKNA